MTRPPIDEALVEAPRFDERGDPESHPLAVVAACWADDEATAEILSADTEGIDGRSPWAFFRLANGDLIFGCYPRGDTYLATETSHPW